MKTKSILICAFVLLINACTAPGTPQPIATAIPASETLPAPEPTKPRAQTEPSPTTESMPSITRATYTDDLAGFSLDYPAGWFIEDTALAHAKESFAYSVALASWDINNPPTPGGKDQNALPEGETKIDVTVVKQAMTLEEAVVQQSQNESGSLILAREDVTLAGELPGVILDVEGFAGPTRTLLTILNGNVIYVSGLGNLENFETIAMTLRAK